MQIKTLQIPITLDVHEALKRKATRRGVSLRVYVTELLEAAATETRKERERD